MGKIIVPRGLAEQFEVIPCEAVRRMHLEDSGPFAGDFRTSCPARRFQKRGVQACTDCEYFGGLGKRTVIGEADAGKPEEASKLFTVICAHPISRAIHYFPED